MVRIMKEEKTKDWLFIAFRIISVLIIIVCLVFLYIWHKHNTANGDIQQELNSYVKVVEDITTENNNEEENIQTEEQVNVLSVDFVSLKEKNADTVAWVKVDNTNIDFPVVKSTNNNYYLKRNFNRESNGAGWIYADYRVPFDELSQNTVIYGHNRRNGTMFSNLTFLLDNNWFLDENNKKFYFSTESSNYIAEIFSVYSMKETSVRTVTDFPDNEQFESFINSVKSISNYDFGVEVSAEDKVITLCTCGNNTKYRILVHAKLVRK